ATIGPPEVRLRSDSGALHVDVSGPFAEHEQDRWPLRLYYGSWSYRILYWKRGSRDTDPASASWVAEVDTRHSSEILAQLEPWTVYCVRVQALIPEWNKTGQLSRELCEQTTHNGVTPVWIIVAVLVGSMLVVGTAVTGCFFSSFYLMGQLERPNPHFLFVSQFLSKPPSALQPFPPREELLVYDKLTVISEQSQTLPEGAGDEASRTPELPQDSAQGDSDS
ncbi:I10R2 protein, partial [Hypocryptadius cinnamomeus]|nr:I10R2 protein [Hypocryptadius cinnamomeus]